MNEPELRTAAADLLGEPVREFEAVRGGRNSRVYRVSSARGRFALKVYPVDGGDARERYEREFGGLRFLWQSGERRVPEPVALGRDHGIALYGWIEGEPVGTAGAAEIGELTAFTAALHERSRLPAASTLPPAREAVFAHGELLEQIRRRAARFDAVAERNPRIRRILEEVRSEVLRLAAGDSPALSAAGRTLSPSDFGFHNTLRTDRGLVFLDFEYFGWDDPVKLVADVVWHPGMSLDLGARDKFFREAADIYKVDSAFRSRFERDAPLYGLRWALIVLNEFLPGMWKRRVAAGGDANQTVVYNRQLAIAETVLARVRSGGPLG